MTDAKTCDTARCHLGMDFKSKDARDETRLSISSKASKSPVDHG